MLYKDNYSDEKSLKEISELDKLGNKDRLGVKNGR